MFCLCRKLSNDVYKNCFDLGLMVYSIPRKCWKITEIHLKFVYLVKLPSNFEPSIFKAFLKAKNSVVCAELAMGWKFHFSQWKTYFSHFTVVMEYLIHDVWNVKSLILCKLPFLFSTVKLKLGHNYSHFINMFKIEIFECRS